MFFFHRKKDLITTQIRVLGMHCPMCTKHVNDALIKVPGVEKVEVDLKAASATIVSKRPLTDDEIKKTVTAAGYQFAGRI